MFSVRFDPPNPVASFLDQLKVIDKAVASTLNKTATQGKTEASRLIRQTFKIKAATARDELTIVRAKTGADAAIIKASGQRVPFFSFPVREFSVSTSKGRRKGVKINRTGAFEVEEGAFLAIVGRGHIGIFKRRGSAAGNSGRDKNNVTKKGRLPIKEPFGNSVKSKFASALVQSPLVLFCEATGARLFDGEFKFFTQKLLNSKLK